MTYCRYITWKCISLCVHEPSILMVVYCAWSNFARNKKLQQQRSASSTAMCNATSRFANGIDFVPPPASPLFLQEDKRLTCDINNTQTYSSSSNNLRIMHASRGGGGSSSPVKWPLCCVVEIVEKIYRI